MDKKSDGTDGKSKAPWIKIIVPVAIIIVVVAIYVIKNMNNSSVPDQNILVAEEQNVEIAEADVDFDSAKFDLEATDAFDLDNLLSYGLPVVIDFGANSCIPCLEMAPVLEELNDELRGKAIIKFVDIQKNSQATQEVPIRVIPTQFFFDKEGKPFIPTDSTIPFVQYGDKETNEVVFTAHEGGMTKKDILAVLKMLGVE